MDWPLIIAIALLVWGGGLVAETAVQWRRPFEENLGMIDKAFLKATGTDKLPPTWVDRFLNRFRLVRKSGYGLAMIFVGGLIILAEMDML
jgi:hypothetical protein